MYEFHYKYIGVRHDNSAKLLFTDTYEIVSVIYEIETNNVYEDFYEDKGLFDFNDCPRDSRFYDPVSKNVIDKMKDEVRETIIHEFVGLKSKMYSLVTIDGGEIKEAKGVNIKNMLMCCLVEDL